MQHPEPDLSPSGIGSKYATRGTPWVSEFNANPPPLLSAKAHGELRLQQQTQPAVTVGDTFTFATLPDEPDVPATARKVVTDGTITLIVWVSDDQWGDVNQSMVDMVTDRFLRSGTGNDIYDWVTAIFGSPWGPHSFSNLIAPDAANQIHILLFDIDNDGFGETGTAGYYFTGNNFLKESLEGSGIPSNERLMFYMDAPLLAKQEGPSWEATDWGPSEVVATLAHEFQHMIHFYQKSVAYEVLSEAWLNEMASEVAEDLVADKIMLGDGPRGVAYHDPTAGSRGITSGRLPRYNLYNDIQVTTWDGNLENYSISYALGAYLARTYGGAALFQSIVQNPGTGTDAIEGALRDRGHNVSFGDVLADWAVANLLSDNTGAPSPYRYNSGTWSTSQAGGETFRLGSINLYNYGTGPKVYSLEQWSQQDRQPPHANKYVTFGRPNIDTIPLTTRADEDFRVTVVLKE